MSQIANITVFDGAATPVSHTLSPVSVSRDANGITAYWRESIATLPSEAQVYLTAKYQTQKNGQVRVETTIGVPVMEAIGAQNASGYTAAPKVAFVDKVTIVGYQHPRSTNASRRLARMLAVNLLNSVSTSVAATTTGPIPELFDQQFVPT